MAKKLVIKPTAYQGPEIKIEVKRENAVCDFCDESTVTFRAPRVIEIPKYTTRQMRVIKEMPDKVRPVFGPAFYKVLEYDYRDVVVDKHYVEEDRFDICANCVKQMAKLVPQMND